MLVEGCLQVRPFRPCLLLHVVLALLDDHGKLRFAAVKSQEVLAHQECQVFILANELFEGLSQFSCVCEEGIKEVFVPRAVDLLILHNEGISKLVLRVWKGFYSGNGHIFTWSSSDLRSEFHLFGEFGLLLKLDNSFQFFRRGLPGSHAALIDIAI